MSEGARLPLTLIAAVARNGVIGRADWMPWRLPGDMAHFRAATMGKPVLMGRKTFESIGRPLPGRHTIVVSSNPNFTPAGVTVVRNPEQAVKAADSIGRRHGASTIMVAGGGTVYRALLSEAQTILLTQVDCNPDGDTRFPAIDPDEWQVVERHQPAQRPDDEWPYVFIRLDRRSRPERQQ